MNRLLIVVAVVCIFTLTASAQTQLTGNWSTQPVPRGWAGWSDSGKPNTYSEQPDLADSPRPRSPNPNILPIAVFVSLKIEGSKVSGFLGVDNVWDLPMKVELGTIEGNAIRFMTVRELPNRDPLYWQWLVELKDDNTIFIHRGNIVTNGAGSVVRTYPNPPPAPTALPTLAKSGFGSPLTLYRVK